MSFASVYVNPICPCLIDLASDTMLLFRPVGDEQWQVEVRGDPHLWERVSKTYQLWVVANCPDVSEYVIDIDEMGRQCVTIPRLMHEPHPPSWMLT